MVAAAQTLTYLDLATTPEDDGNRYELLGGELVVTASPAKKHIRVSYRLARMLSNHIEEFGLGEVFPAPVDVKLTPFDVVVPDIIFLKTDRLNLFGEQLVDGPPDLIVEVLSPSTRVRDKTAKLSLYARTGVAEYWIVDTERESVSAHALQATGKYLRVEPIEGVVISRVLPDLRIKIADLFQGLG